MPERTTEWAFALLRPILKELKVQQLKKSISVVRASAHRKLILAGMGRWIIVARQSSFADQKKGCAIIALDIQHNLFLLQISVDKNMFTDDEHSSRISRKIVAVHEFVHGSAHMFLSSFLKSERYIEFMKKSMESKMRMTTSEEFNAMISAIGKLGTKDVSRLEVFTDGHFRLLEDGFIDGFDGSFSELYTYLLLSYQLVNETMTAIKIKHEPAGIDISELLTLTFNELVNKKALDEEFVLGRMKLFLPMLYEKFA